MTAGRAWRQFAVLVMSLGLSMTAAPAWADVANPPWPRQCPLKLGLLVDHSGSMAARFPEVREATKNVVDALRDKRSEVTVIGFSGAAEVIKAAVDVSDRSTRHQLKENIDDLDTSNFFVGGTNWEAALALAEPLGLDVAVMITDGEPNVSSGTTSGSPGPVEDAAAVADRMKAAGTRVVTIGIDLAGAGSLSNLTRISGPVKDSDYYLSGSVRLLRQLYEIVANSCGVPLAALPKPEPPAFPLAKVVLGALAGLLLLVAAGYLLYRTRGGRVRPATNFARQVPARIADPTIGHGEAVSVLKQPAADPPAGRLPPRPAGRSRSLDFLSRPDSNERNDL